MADNEPLPSKAGLRETQELLKRFRERKPSEDLVQIIDEVTRKEGETGVSDDRAVKKRSSNLDI